MMRERYANGTGLPNQTVPNTTRPGSTKPEKNSDGGDGGRTPARKKGAEFRWSSDGVPTEFRGYLTRPNLTQPDQTVPNQKK